MFFVGRLSAADDSTSAVFIFREFITLSENKGMKGVNDVKVLNQYCVITDDDGNVILAELVEKARIETRHKVEVFKTLKDIEKKKIKLPPPEENVVEKNKLYSHNGKIICSSVSGHINKIDKENFIKDKEPKK